MEINKTKTKRKKKTPGRREKKKKEGTKAASRTPTPRKQKPKSVQTKSKNARVETPKPKRNRKKPKGTLQSPLENGEEKKKVEKSVMPSLLLPPPPPPATKMISPMTDSTPIATPATPSNPSPTKPTPVGSMTPSTLYNVIDNYEVDSTKKSTSTTGQSGPLTMATSSHIRANLYNVVDIADNGEEKRTSPAATTATTGSASSNQLKMETPSNIRANLYNVVDIADAGSETNVSGRQIEKRVHKSQSVLSIAPVQNVANSKEDELSLKKTQSESDRKRSPEQPKTPEQLSMPDVNNQRSELQMPIQLPMTTSGNTIHPLSAAKLDMDLVGRTGMYIERSGMPKQRKKAFDWLALNRHNFVKCPNEVSDNLGIALSDIGVQRKLLLDTFELLMLNNQITRQELIVLKTKLAGIAVCTMSTAAWLLKENCQMYKKTGMAK